MKPQAQRGAIVDACPQLFEMNRGRFNAAWNVRYVASGAPCDPLADLNAMHEAEKTLTPPQSERFAEFVLDVLQIPSPFIGTARCAFLTGHATAAQRAEAFLRTLNLWRDDPAT